VNNAEGQGLFIKKTIKVTPTINGEIAEGQGPFIMKTTKVTATNEDDQGLLRQSTNKDDQGLLRLF
jgi:hypothetical protein